MIIVLVHYYSQPSLQRQTIVRWQTKIVSRKRQLLSNNTISVSIMPKMPTEIPLFPLPIVVFPQEKRALHIFEERYKAMVRYCLDANEVFGMISLETTARLQKQDAPCASAVCSTSSRTGAWTFSSAGKSGSCC